MSDVYFIRHNFNNEEALRKYCRDNKRITIHFTHAADSLTVKRKAEKLKRYATEMSADKNIIAVFAGPSVHRDLITAMGLRFLSIEEMFDSLASRAEYKRMLKELIGITNLDYQ